MGMFDYVVCMYPLPEELPEWLKVEGLFFQTKSLDNLLRTYFITEEGSLLLDAYGAGGDDSFMTARERIQYHGDITFYTNNLTMIGPDKAAIYKGTGPYPYSVDLNARFTEGTLTDLWVIKAGTFAEDKEIRISDTTPRVVGRRGDGL